MMKFYKIRYDKILPIYLILLMVSFTFLSRLSEIRLWEILLAFISGSAMLFIIFWGHAQTIVVSDEGISISLVVLGKIIKCQLFIKWLDVWKVEQYPNREVFYVVPYKKIIGVYRFKLREMVNILSLYRNYEEILIDVVNNAKNADIDDSVFKKIQEYKDKKNNRNIYEKATTVKQNSGISGTVVK